MQRFQFGISASFLKKLLLSPSNGYHNRSPLDLSEIQGGLLLKFKLLLVIHVQVKTAGNKPQL